MSNKIIAFMSLRRLPARLTAEQASWLLGCQPEHMSLLVARKVVKYLGNPVQSATKYFALAEIQEISDSSEKVAKITDIIYKYWQEKNANRKGRNELDGFREAA